MICSLFDFCPQFAQSRRHGGASVGLAPSYKTPSPQIEICNTEKSVEFFQFLECQASLHKFKAPIENFLATVLRFPLIHLCPQKAQS